MWNPPQKVEEIYKLNKSHAFSAINRPTAGPQYEEQLPMGKAPFQLYSLATPNGQKPAILLEELGIAYDAHVIRIMACAQFSSGFVNVNPNSKIPAALDCAPADFGPPIRLFEASSIMLYLAEKHNRFLPTDPRKRAETLNWLIFSQTQATITGNYGHFFTYAPDNEVDARNYGVNRYAMDVQRMCNVLDRHLSDGRRYLIGSEYTIADMAVLPWFYLLRIGYVHGASNIKTKDFLNVAQYRHVNAWADRLYARPEVQRGMLVCRKKPKPWLVDKRFKHLNGLKSRL